MYMHEDKEGAGYEGMSECLYDEGGRVSGISVNGCVRVKRGRCVTEGVYRGLFSLGNLIMNKNQVWEWHVFPRIPLAPTDDIYEIEWT